MRTTTLASLCLLSSSLVAQIGLKCENTAATTSGVYIQAPYNKTLVPQSGLTVEAWITYDETTLGGSWRYPTIARLNPNASREAWWFRIDAGNTNARNLAFGYQTTAGLRRITYNFAPQELQTWTHVAATFQNGTANLYVNGDLKATGTGGATLTDQGGDLYIGNGDGNLIENWNGEIDELRLWPFARTADEIKSTMNLAMSSVPGEVSTWALDFSPVDGSGSNDGMDVNSPNYAVNSLTLTGANIGAEAFGAGTAGCVGTPAAGVSGQAKAGNMGFAITCVHAGTGAGTVGFFWLGVARFTTPVQIAGADLWVNTTAGLLLPRVGDANRLIKVVAPLPGTLTTGTTVYGQFFFTETGCSVPVFASEGLKIEIQ